MGTLEERALILANSSLHDKCENQLAGATPQNRAMERRPSPAVEGSVPSHQNKYLLPTFLQPGRGETPVAPRSGHDKIRVPIDSLMRHVFNTLLFTILVPTTAAGWIPQALRGNATSTPSIALRALSFLLITLGIATYLHTAFWGFALHGHGTPAPIAPTQKLVVEGLHRYVRNPMYLGVLLIVIGQAVLFRSRTLVFYAGVIWLAAHVFVLLYEEPTLERKFGNEYRKYRQRVPRWIPRF
jgi:protein-S-isoprenylcysteine O-methyltransferase Ste14